MLLEYRILRNGLAFVSLCVAAGLMVSPVQAHLLEYTPFVPGKQPKQFQVEELAELRYEPGQMDLAEKGRSRQSRNPIVRIAWTHDKAGSETGISLTMLTSDGRQTAGPFRVSFSPVVPFGYIADINHDSKPDYILISYLGGNGAIGGGSKHVVFAISAKTTYRVFMIASIYPELNDFLNIKDDGEFQFLQQEFVSTHPMRGKDDKSHNYWVYNLFKVEGSDLKLDNSLLNGFPKWILYTFRANHTETDQLTEQQKRQLFNPGQTCLISTPEKPCPGYFPN